MVNALRVEVLVTDAFGGFGGIAKFNRDFLSALDCCALVERAHVLPRIITGSIENAIPESIVYDRPAAAGKLAFSRRVVAHALRRGRIDLVICGHIHLLPAAWVLARITGARLALILHGIEAWGPTSSALTNRLTLTIDAAIAVSRHSADQFATWSKVSLSRITILPNCVDLNRFVPQQRDSALIERYGLQSSNVILTVGRLSHQERYKGFDEVMDVMPELLKRFPSLKYLIVGDGDDCPRLKAKSTVLGVQGSVIFAGRILECEKVAHYNLADAYVMPSRGEGFGIVFIEAAACGVPVIAGGTDASRETLMDGQLGRTVDPTSPSELVEEISAVLEGRLTRGRNPKIDRFSVAAFRARVNSWCESQVAAVTE